MNNSRPVIL